MILEFSSKEYAGIKKILINIVRKNTNMKKIFRKDFIYKHLFLKKGLRKYIKTSILYTLNFVK